MPKRSFTSVMAAPLVSALAAMTLSCDSGSGADGGNRMGPAGVPAPTYRAVPEPAIDWSPEIYAARWVSKAPVVDGRVEEEEWAAAFWTSDFVDIRGPSGPTPRFRTRARMLWDSEYFYVAAELEEPHVWGTLVDRDAVIYRDNDFEVFIDPDGDTHLYYELEINALGTVWDLMLVKPYRDGGPAIDAWDIRGLRTAVGIDGSLNDPSDRDAGWSVEIAIPWSVLSEAAGRPAPPLPGDRWRVNFSRVQWQADVREGRYFKRADPDTGDSLDEDNWVWSPQGLVAMHYPEMWGIVEFIGPDGRQSGIETAGAVDEADRALWALRQVYYRQRQRADSTGAWASSAPSLGLAEAPAPGVQWPPRIQITPRGFEATVALTDGRTAGIREDGLTWITD